MKKYYDELTILKGIGIILVILGHSFSFTGFNIVDNNFINKYIFYTIYSFHMPLFFMIAGFLTSNYKDNLNKKFYISKIKRLLIPYIFINIIDAIPRHLFSNLVNNKNNGIEKIIFYSGAATWFVYTLFILFLIFPIIEKYIIKRDKYYLFGIVLFILNLFEIGSNIKIFTIDRLIYMSFYFYIGYILKKDYKKICGIILGNRYFYIIVLLFFIIGRFYTETIIMRVLFPFLGIFSLWYIVMRNKDIKGKLYNFLIFCGENSLSFYLLEVFCGTVYRVILIKIIPIEYNFLLVSTFFLSKLITLVISVKYIITKNKYLAFLLGAKYDKV
jgi:fucose 4-O-acetylase-like acetyltransferase